MSPLRFNLSHFFFLFPFFIQGYIIYLWFIIKFENYVGIYDILQYFLLLKKKKQTSIFSTKKLLVELFAFQNFQDVSIQTIQSVNITKNFSTSQKFAK